VEDDWLFLAHVEGCGPAPIPKLLLPELDPAALRDPAVAEPWRRSLPPAAQKRWLEAAPAAVAARIRAEASAAGLHVLTPAHECWPPGLRGCPSPPLVLFVRGRPETLVAPGLHVAVVGSRTPTPYGRCAARDFATALARCEIVIWSGLAVGVDGAAHRAAVEQGTPTVAVLAGGLDSVYPREHAALAAAIVAGGGALVSEAAVGVRPTRGHFPRRNRILGAATSATLVVEAGFGSGSLHTARFASDAGADVFAVPGPYSSPRSRGCHILIEQGAGIASDPATLLRQLSIHEQFLPDEGVAHPGLLDLHADGACIVRVLQQGPRPSDLVQRETGLARKEFLHAIQQLCDAGWLERLPGDLLGLSRTPAPTRRPEGPEADRPRATDPSR